MARTTPLVEADQLRAKPSLGAMTELVSGDVVQREKASGRHDRIVARVAEVLERVVEADDLGAVFRAPWPVELSKYDLVKPDIYLVGWRDGVIRVDGVYGTPDLVIEVTSPESRARDLGEKQRLYSWAGVTEYWVIDLEERQVKVMTKANQGYTPIELVGNRAISQLIPEFSLDLDGIFPAEG